MRTLSSARRGQAVGRVSVVRLRERRESPGRVPREVFLGQTAQLNICVICVKGLYVVYDRKEGRAPTAPHTWQTVCVRVCVDCVARRGLRSKEQQPELSG